MTLPSVLHRSFRLSRLPPARLVCPSSPILGVLRRSDGSWDEAVADCGKRVTQLWSRLRLNGVTANVQPLMLAVQLLSASWSSIVESTVVAAAGELRRTHLQTLRVLSDAQLRAAVGVRLGVHHDSLRHELGRVDLGAWRDVVLIAYAARLLAAPLVADELAGTLHGAIVGRDAAAASRETRRLLPLPAAAAAGENPARQVLLAQLLRPRDWPSTSLGEAVLSALRRLTIPCDQLLATQPSRDAVSARAEAAGWRRRALRGACERQARAVLAEASRRPGSSAAHMLSCASGIDSAGRVVPAALVVAPMPYLHTPLCRPAARLRLLLRVNALPTPAFQQRFGGDAGAVGCGWCGLRVPATALHLLRDCRAALLVANRRQALEQFCVGLRDAGARRDLASSLVLLLTRGLRGSSDFLQFMSGVTPAWWFTPLRNQVGAVTGRGNPHTVAGYAAIGPAGAVVDVRVRLLAPWLDRLALDLLASLWRPLRLPS